MITEVARIKKEELTAKKKTWYLANEEKCQERSRKYHHAHREELREINRAYYLAHKERHRLLGIAYRKAHPQQAWLRKIFVRYGITGADFNDLLTKQGGVCAICRTDHWGARGPHVDHDHNTGKIRGILCRRCNVVLGEINDNPDIARAMNQYLLNMAIRTDTKGE